MVEELTFAAGAVATLPGLLNPAGLLGEYRELFLAGMDLVAGLAVGVPFITAAARGSGPSLA